ncbi:hypothetical protein EB670_02785 [Escherichia coli]|nr:hypothetical protein EB670_02785 [Escherichia coli]
MPENPASYRVVRTKSYLFNKAANLLNTVIQKSKFTTNINNYQQCLILYQTCFSTLIHIRTKHC